MRPFWLQSGDAQKGVVMRGLMRFSPRVVLYIGAVLLFLLFGLVMWGLHVFFVTVVLLVVILPLAIYDLAQKKHSLLRNFPVVGHLRYFFEFFRPEVRQYFVSSDTEELPFHRADRSAVYRKAKDMSDIIPFGSDRNQIVDGYEWGKPSLVPLEPATLRDKLVPVGRYSESCKQIYHAKRLNISAMSFGALSANAVVALNKAASRGRFYHNTGEGGLTPYHLHGGDLVWQIGTGYFGCRKEDGTFDPEKFALQCEEHPSVKMIEIKLSQGAKPGEGGILPGAKVTPEIAALRGVPVGKSVYSPVAHSAFTMFDGLPNFVEQLRVLSGGRPVGIKLAMGHTKEFVRMCKVFHKTGIHPDFITIDGGEGGTGAAPAIFSNRLAALIRDALNIAQNILVASGLRKKIVLIGSGKFTSGFDMVVARALGADIVNSARGMMFAMGCIQALQCHQNTCPVGITTQNSRLTRALNVEDKADRVYNFHKNVLLQYYQVLAAMGIRSPEHLSASMVMRRLDMGRSVDYGRYYEWCKEDAFLTGKCPPAWQDVWDKS